MICVNFGHPLTVEQVHQIETLCRLPIERVIEVTCQIDENETIWPQISAIADRAGLSTSQWQTLALIVIPPPLHIAATVLMAELHGRMGHFPSIVRFRSIDNHQVVRFEVVEIVNLHEIRQKARQMRGSVTNRTAS